MESYKKLMFEPSQDIESYNLESTWIFEQRLEVSQGNIWGESVPGRGNWECQALGVETGVRNSKEARMAERGGC